jgi:hypothetical protein
VSAIPVSGSATRTSSSPRKPAPAPTAAHSSTGTPRCVPSWVDEHGKTHWNTRCL